MRKHQKSRRRGLTLLELLVVTAIIAVLISMLLPAIQKAHDAAIRGQCQNNLRQMALAVQDMNDTNGTVPPIYGPYPNNKGNTSRGNVHFYMLPYIEQQNIYQRGYTATASGGYYISSNGGTQYRAIKLYMCPSDPSMPPGGVIPSPNNDAATWGVTTYAANALVFGNIQKGSPINGVPNVMPKQIQNAQPTYTTHKIPSSFPDGTSNTIFFTEKYAQCGSYGSHWAASGYPYSPSAGTYNKSGTQVIPSSGTDYWEAIVCYNSPAFGQPNCTFGLGAMFQVQPTPYQTNCDYTRAASPHLGGINAALGDGSVRFVAASINPLTWWIALVPNDELPMPSDW